VKILSKLVFALCALLYFTSLPVSGQQPFYTDDTDVTDRHKFHVQVSNEFDLLQRISLPAKTQDVAIFELDYGLLKGVEIGFDGPWLRIHSAPIVIPNNAVGIGDASFHIKYNFLTEREGSRRPALGLSMIVQAPTGNETKQLGTGLIDYYVNGIIQKSLPQDTKLRLNGGIVFAGNTVNGVLGIKSSRGKVFTGGGSLVRQFSQKLDLGIELTGAVSGNFDLSKGQLQALIGGNYAIRKNLTFDFGLVAGHFAASPRAGAQIGLSLDF
jgi:hypothetical protein